MRRDSRDYARWKRKKKLKRGLLQTGLLAAGIMTGIVIVKGVHVTKSNIHNGGLLMFGQSFLQGTTVNTEQVWNNTGEEEQQELQQDVVQEEGPEITEENENRITTEEQETESKEEIQNDTVEYVGVSEAGKEYAYDAEIVAKKLSSYDYYNEEEKVVFLTFDDGVSTTVTPKILDVLAAYDVKATFFLVGKTIEDGGETAKNLIRREFEEGHALANHTYSHDYSKLYPGRTLDIDYFVKDLNRTDELLKEILGVNFRTRVFRCPGGFMSWNNMSPLKEYQEAENRVSIDWNSLTKDAEGKKKNASELFECMIETNKGKDMVVLLMHDTYGKEETVKALPKIIEYYKEQGYVFRTLV